MCMSGHNELQYPSSICANRVRCHLGELDVYVFQKLLKSVSGPIEIFHNVHTESCPDNHSGLLQKIPSKLPGGPVP